MTVTPHGHRDLGRYTVHSSTPPTVRRTSRAAPCATYHTSERVTVPTASTCRCTKFPSVPCASLGYQLAKCSTRKGFGRSVMGHKDANGQLNPHD